MRGQCPGSMFIEENLLNTNDRLLEKSLLQINPGFAVATKERLLPFTNCAKKWAYGLLERMVLQPRRTKSALGCAGQEWHPVIAWHHLFPVTSFGTFKAKK